eukprot:TRINITY_DN82933_c0_g1_i3.p4 TRINITY_DN82933_c0_g1~~TRINITY_DN82933_c0_g1_i3.p4  ORF type:complete len:131 (+),score=6.28 TRINITY_DN82933_c0_g1_i3:527-919(+)
MILGALVHTQKRILSEAQFFNFFGKYFQLVQFQIWGFNILQIESQIRQQVCVVCGYSLLSVSSYGKMADINCKGLVFQRLLGSENLVQFFPFFFQVFQKTPKSLNYQILLLFLSVAQKEAHYKIQLRALN